MLKEQVNGGPAFPKAAGTWEKLHEAEGMSLRDWFAGMALSAMISANLPKPAHKGEEWFNPGFTASCAYGMADAMLAQRKSKED